MATKAEIEHAIVDHLCGLPAHTWRTAKEVAKCCETIPTVVVTVARESDRLEITEASINSVRTKPACLRLVEPCWYHLTYRAVVHDHAWQAKALYDRGFRVVSDRRLGWRFVCRQ